MLANRFSWSAGSKKNCISIDGSAFTSTYSWHYVVLTWDGSSMVLYIDGTATSSGINTDFAECLEYSGKLIFGQDGDFSAGKKMGMEQDSVAMYHRAWAASEIVSGRRYVVSDDSDLYALWSDSSGTDATANGNAATITTSSVGTGCTEALKLKGWSYGSVMSSGSWVFPAQQSSYYFSTVSTFVLSTTYTIETWVKPFSTSSSYSW
jgi:hypothetical protein